MQANYENGAHMPSAYTFLAMLNHAVWKRLFLNREPLDRLVEELERSSFEAQRQGAAAMA
jgi:hypothetical protein